MPVTTPLSSARSAVAQALLARVAGPEATATRVRIHGTPGPRWFPADSPIGRVHGDASMFAGGVRALLLQSLHPRAMAAVADHSGYRSDPWGRLQRTATFLATTTFATAEDAAQAVAIVRAVHAHIRGTTPEGEPYEASDPHLLRWVHVAEVDSFLRAHQRYGREPLDEAGCDEYVAQSAVIARALGAEGVPVTVAELDDVVTSYRPELAPSAAAAEAAEFLLRRPPLPLPARPAYALIAAKSD
uniref:oxygenase MpaB family protein n=1 Tax=Actinotalea sp. C106 TaxID=2908644 RepID=UPI0020288316